MIEQMKEDFTKLKDSAVALSLGFIYVQLPKEKAPAELWPSFKWADISATYDSTFFRVAGSAAAPFGSVQQQQGPPFIDAILWDSCHLTWLDSNRIGCYPDEEEEQPDNALNRTDLYGGKSGWSPAIWTAFNYPQVPDNNKKPAVANYHRYHVSNAGAEVRPRNMAVKVWRRVG